MKFTHATLALAVCVAGGFSLISCAGPVSEYLHDHSLPEVSNTGGLTFGEHPMGPKLSGAEGELIFRLARSTRDGVPSTLLLGAARVSGDHAQRYGGRVRSAIFLVAIDGESGLVRSANLDRPGSFPLPPMTRASQGEGEFSSDLFVGASETHFQVDLRAHLGLPAAGGTFHLFLWLDGLCSESQTLLLSPDPSRPDGPESSAGVPIEVRWSAPAPSGRAWAALEFDDGWRGQSGPWMVLILDQANWIVRSSLPQTFPAGGAGSRCWLRPVQGQLSLGRSFALGVAGAVKTAPVQLR